MAGIYTTGQDANGNWYVYNQGVIPMRGGMYYFGDSTKQFDAAKNQLNAAGGQEVWEGYQQSGGGGGSSAPSGSYGGGGGGGAGSAPLNTALIRNTQRTIDEIPGLLRDALDTERTRFRNANRVFDVQEQQQRGTYDKSTITNQQNYDENFMDSIRAGIQGLGGLVNILRGTGASGGSVEGDARDVVGGVTANDIRQGADVRDENQTALDTSLGNFLTDLKGRRQENEDTFVNNQRAIRRDSQAQLQELYGRVADIYGDAGREAEANTWLNRAGNLTPSIARNSRTQISKYDASPIDVSAPELTAFSGPSQPNLAPGESPQQVGSGIFTISDRGRNREERRTSTSAGV